MRLAILQCGATDGGEAAAFARITAALTSAVAMGARMLVLPELILPGYNRPDLHRSLAQGMDGVWMARLSAMANAAGCGLTFGWAEADGDLRYNAASAIGPDGTLLAHYRKIQLYGAMEGGSFAPGTTPPPVFEFEGLRCGLLICYDIEFPEHARTLAARGAQLLLVPTANPAGFDHVPQILVPARAYENRMTVAYANYAGSDGDIAFGGLSTLIGPDGAALATAGRCPALLIADLTAPDALPEGRLSTQAQDLRRIG